MRLARLYLNALNRDVQRAIADSHALHSLVMKLFPHADESSARKTFSVLHRLDISERDGLITLLVQSRVAPDPKGLPPNVLDPRAGPDALSITSLEPLLGQLERAAVFRFRLRANPTRCIDTKTGTDGKRRRGRRVPLRGDDERLAWLRRKLDAGGLTLVSEGGHPLVRQEPAGTTRGGRGELHMTHEAHVFEGVVQVVDGRRAREALLYGIGPAKAFGFGLLSLAPVSSSFERSS